MSRILFLAFVLAWTGCKTRHTTSESEAKLIGGQSSNVDLVGRIMYDAGTSCSGTLIRPNLVLTAAHCVIDPSRANERGRNCESPDNAYYTGRMSGVTFSTGSQRASVDYAWSIGSDIGDDDIAIMRLSRNLRGSRLDHSYNISFTSGPASSGNYAIGYGCTRTEYDAQCDTYYGVSGSGGFRQYVNVDNGFTQSCPGDSGGAVMSIKDNGNGYNIGIYGVISWFRGSLPDAERVRHPAGSGYAKVGRWKNWISEKISQYGASWQAAAPAQPAQPSQPQRPAQPQQPRPANNGGSGCLNRDEMLSRMECRYGLGNHSAGYCRTLQNRHDQHGSCP